MDYETFDGSQFSLLPIWSDPDNGDPEFLYTSISANVDGVAYTGRVDQQPDEVDEADVLTSLEPVPVECINPPYEEAFTLAPALDADKHYWKAPSFTYDDCRPGNTFVANCLLNEVRVLERLRQNPHPNLATYHGCVVKAGRITHICLQRYQSNLVDHVFNGNAIGRRDQILADIRAGIDHLHSLGLAHNDVNPYNICVNEDGSAVIIDLDSCLPFNEPLQKGIDLSSDDQRPTSSMDNDLNGGMNAIEDFLENRPVPNEE
jgi:hypothetical protein